MTKKPTRDELIAMLKQRDWQWQTKDQNAPIKDRPLEDLVRLSYERHRKGEDAGIINKMEAMLEIDLIQLQELWVHLGLPM